MYSLLALYLFSLITIISADNLTVAIIGTNDIHGSAFPTSFKTTNQNNETIRYKSGGLIYMARLINIIKQQYPNNTLYLDAGDQFQGAIQSSKLISSGKIMNDFFGIQKNQASAIGNHEFDFGPSFLFPFLKAKDGPNLAANLRSENNIQNFLPNQKASQIYIFGNGIKVGVIGLSTIYTPITTSGFSANLFPQYKFLKYKDIVISESQKLKKNGANAILIVSHVGNECNRNLTYKIWTKQDNQQGYCQEAGQIGSLLRQLPEGTVHGVIQGHHHTVSHLFIDGIPIMGNINGGFYFNVMYLTFNRDKVLLDAKIEGPIPVCEKIFQNTGRCEYVKQQDKNKMGELINWKFHNKEVYADPRLQSIYKQQWQSLMEPYFQELVENEILLYSEWNKQSELGNLMTDLIHQTFCQADFVIMNPGGFRTQWLPGIIQEQHYFNMFPFDNKLVSFNISGKQLKQTIRILQTGSGGLYDFYGIQTTLKSVNSKFQFLSTKFSNGQEIEDDEFYEGISLDFLINGGDDFSTVINSGVYIPRNVNILGDFKQKIRQPLKKRKIIQKDTLIDPHKPRIIIE